MQTWPGPAYTAPSMVDITPLAVGCLPPLELQVPEIRPRLLSSHSVARPQLFWHSRDQQVVVERTLAEKRKMK